VIVHFKAPSKVRSVTKANQFLSDKNIGGVLQGTFTAGLLQGKAKIICADYGVIKPTPTEFLDLSKLEEEGDDDDEDREGDAEDVDMEDLGTG